MTINIILEQKRAIRGDLLSRLIQEGYTPQAEARTIREIEAYKTSEVFSSNEINLLYNYLNIESNN